MLINYNNLCCFINIKSLSSCQVQWAQELSRYYFQINYCQNKVNRVAYALSCFSQKDDKEKANSQVENTKFFYYLQFLLTNTSLSDLNLFPFSNPSSLLFQYQVFICKTHSLQQPRQFHDVFRLKLANKSLFKAIIGCMRLKLEELQKTDFKAQKLRQKDQKNFQKIDRILHYQDLLFVTKAIQKKLISHYYNDFLNSYFGIEKTCTLLARKYYWPIFRYNIKAYIKGCAMYLALKTMRHKPYSNFQSLQILSQ